MKNDAPFTFAAVAQPVAERGWRPFPGLQTSKIPAMCGWSGLNAAEWDGADLVAAVSEYQPPEDYCCCFAVQPEVVAIDADITDQAHVELHGIPIDVVAHRAQIAHWQTELAAAEEALRHASPRRDLFKPAELQAHLNDRAR